MWLCFIEIIDIIKSSDSKCFVVIVNVTDIPRFVIKLTKLKHLDLSSNKICFIQSIVVFLDIIPSLEFKNKRMSIRYSIL